MNAKLRINAKNYFRKNVFKLMNNALSKKTMENVINYRDIKFVSSEVRRNYLVSGPNSYNKKKIFQVIY